jgi:uncharacterized membrane protein YgcG
MFVIGILVVVAIGTLIWAIGSARNEAKEVERQADVLDDYTSQIRGVLQPLNTPASEMATVPTTSSPKLVKQLDKTAAGWRTSLSSAQEALSGVLPEDDVAAVHGLIAQAILGYTNAADTFALVPKADEKLQDDLLLRGASQNAQAGQVLTGAIAILDQLRGEVDLSPSGLRAPDSAPQTQPSPIPTVLPTEDGGGGGNSGGGNDSGGNGGGGDNSGGGNDSGGNGGG